MLGRFKNSRGKNWDKTMERERQNRVLYLIGEKCQGQKVLNNFYYLENANVF